MVIWIRTNALIDHSSKPWEIGTVYLIWTAEFREIRKCLFCVCVFICMWVHIYASVCTHMCVSVEVRDWCQGVFFNFYLHYTRHKSSSWSWRWSACLAWSRDSLSLLPENWTHTLTPLFMWNQGVWTRVLTVHVASVLLSALSLQPNLRNFCWRWLSLQGPYCVSMRTRICSPELMLKQK